MKHRLDFKQAREVEALKAALDQNLSAVFEAFSGLPYAPEPGKQAGREFHSMELGRDLPPYSPHVDSARSSDRIGDFTVSINAEVARWNPHEVARCFFSANLGAPGGATLRLLGGAESRSTIDHLEIELSAPAEPNAQHVMELLARMLDA